MKLKKVKSVKRADGKGYYYKYVITPIPEDIAEKSGLIERNVKITKVEKGKIIIEKE